MGSGLGFGRERARLLPIEALLEALRDQPVDIHRPALAVAVRAVHGLQVVRRVPVGVEDDDARGRCEVETEPACAGGDEEEAQLVLRAVEGLDLVRVGVGVGVGVRFRVRVRVSC